MAARDVFVPVAEVDHIKPLSAGGDNSESNLSEGAGLVKFDLQPGAQLELFEQVSSQSADSPADFIMADLDCAVVVDVRPFLQAGIWEVRMVRRHDHARAARPIELAGNRKRPVRFATGPDIYKQPRSLVQAIPPNEGRPDNLEGLVSQAGVSDRGNGHARCLRIARVTTGRPLRN